MIDARAETVDEKPAYRDAFWHWRCLIPANGFYRSRVDNGKQPYFIQGIGICFQPPQAERGIGICFQPPQAERCQPALKRRLAPVHPDLCRTKPSSIPPGNAAACRT